MKSLVLILLVFTTVHGDDMCKTCSCTTSDNDQILSINCTNRSMQNIGETWPEQNTTKTIKISFAGNNIVTLQPMPHTDAVIEIVLSRCNLQYLVPGLFMLAKNIKFLDLSYNKLAAEEIASEKFRGPYNSTTFEPIALEHLDLSYNQIHSLGKNVFEHMPDLKILNLEGNDFSVLDIHTQLALSSIRKLQSLNLANNELTEMIVGAIESHDNLTELDLSLNDLDFVPRSLAHIGKSLEVLKLDSNPIIELASESFLGLGNIIELSLNNLTKVKYVNGNTFASMPKLKKLNLSNNFQLTNIDREAFGINQTLEEFYLNNNDLYHIDYLLLPWSKLRTFEFKENPLDCSCDLYNITIELSDDITRQEDSPFCRDPRNNRYSSVFYLKSDICSYKSEHKERNELIHYHFSMVKVFLVVLSIFVLITALMVVIVGGIRYRRYRRQMDYPFASQISYNPVSTNPKF